MLILKFLPDLAFHMMVAISSIGLIATLVFGFVPLIRRYKTVTQIIFIVIFTIGIYFEGFIANESAWKAKVSALEIKLAQTEAHSATENIKIIEMVAIKEKIIREHADAITQYIDREIVKYDENCVIPQVFIDVHNQSASRP